MVRWPVGIASLGVLMLVLGSALAFHSGPPRTCLATMDGDASITECRERLAQTVRCEQFANAAWFGTAVTLTILGTAIALTHRLR